MAGKLRWLAAAGMCLGLAAEAAGWGNTGHKFVNSNAIQHLPPALSPLIAQQVFLRDHASDADYRKSTDTAEYPKHFIDLESYPDFRHLPPSLDPLIASYGWTVVKEIGILPWATVWAMDSLTAQFRRRDWAKAYQTAADLGHYVADAHQPLHCTVNYNGVLTGNTGIHSRYETGMLDQAALSVVPDSARYITDRFAYALALAVHANGFVDSILQGDNAAKLASGWNGSGQPPVSYYAALWQYCGGFTRQLFQEATVALASLWYTAWVDAGLSVTTAVERARSPVPAVLVLMQNYPNPFNGTSEVRFRVGESAEVRLQVLDLLGREVGVLVDERKIPGEYTVRFDAGRLASGTYLLRLSAGRYVQTTKALLLR